MSTSDEIVAARAALACLVEPGSPEVYRLVERVGPVAAVDRIVAGDGVAEQVVAAAQARLRDRTPADLAEAVLARTRRIGARLVVPEDDEWPGQLGALRLISDGRDRVSRDTFPPVGLWVRGDWSLADTLGRSVAVVGARAATSYGNHVATEIAHGMANRGWAVVSGGAYGIDAAAHRGTLAAGGVTVAVLACGVDRPYPSGHASLFERIAEDGLLISEWPPGADPHRHRFLVRNRVIAALTRGTVLVEANARSGARQTLNRAIQLGRVSMAVPGPVTSAMSVGCHEAIRTQGVRLVTSYQEVLEEVGLIGDDLAPPVRGPEGDLDRLGPELSRVLDAVPHRGASPDQIAAAAGLPLRQVLRALPGLEATGHVVKRDDGGYALARRPTGQAPPPVADPAPAVPDLPPR